MMDGKQCREGEKGAGWRQRLRGTISHRGRQGKPEATGEKTGTKARQEQVWGAGKC